MLPAFFFLFPTVKHIIYTALLTAAAAFPHTLQAKNGDLLPKPQQMAIGPEAAFKLNRAVTLTDPTQCAYLANVLRQNGCTLRNRAKAKVEVKLVDHIEGAFDHAVALFPNEAYRLHITPNRVCIEAVTPTGVVRAAQTLQQLAEGYEPGAEAFEALTLTDWPAFKVRGFMHDVGRSFMEFEELKKQIDLLARFKVNVFHWHLTDYTGWRFEVKAYPNLTAAAFNIRQPGKFYTQAQCRELVAYARERGVTVIPEIDMPGHSHVFEKAMGFDMQTDQGVEALKRIVDEAAEVFDGVPYLHIGGDEVQITYPNFLQIMTDHVRSKGLKVVLWNRLVAGPPSADLCDMTQMWATSGKVVKGVTNIDCRYNYTNHFDVYADLVGIYKSNIYYEQQGTNEVAGTISAAWNDTKTRTDADIVKQNNLYANVLASAERAWRGGGKQYIEKGVRCCPTVVRNLRSLPTLNGAFFFTKTIRCKMNPLLTFGKPTCAGALPTLSPTVATRIWLCRPKRRRLMCCLRRSFTMDKPMPLIWQRGLASICVTFGTLRFLRFLPIRSQTKRHTPGLTFTRPRRRRWVRRLSCTLTAVRATKRGRWRVAGTAVARRFG